MDVGLRAAALRAVALKGLGFSRAATYEQKKCGFSRRGGALSLWPRLSRLFTGHGQSREAAQK